MNITWNAMNDSPASGSLYSYNQKREIKIHENNIKIANGIAFNNKIKKMFYVDSVKKGVDRFDYDIENGTVSNREVWFSLPKNNLVGFPDGITIDADGNIWVAVFYGSSVIKIDGYKAETLLDTVKLPATQVCILSLFENRFQQKFCLDYISGYWRQKFRRTLCNIRLLPRRE